MGGIRKGVRNKLMNNMNKGKESLETGRPEEKKNDWQDVEQKSEDDQHKGMGNKDEKKDGKNN